jgi:hypothetical protein
MHTVFPLRHDITLPPITDLVSGRPTRWLGLPVVWQVSHEPVPVYIGRWSLPDKRDVFLFGARYDLAEAEVGGQSLAPGHFVEFFAVTGGGDRWETTRLLNRLSVTFSATDEQGDYVPATALSDPVSRSVTEPPHWAHRSEAQWPTSDGTPMTFVGQVQLPRTPITETRLTWDATFYLFWSRSDAGPDTFKLVQQDPLAQSAEDHYADEERRWAADE